MLCTEYVGGFGNVIGLLLTKIACSNLSGAHIIILITDIDVHHNSGENSLFWKYLPKVIVHPSPQVSLTSVADIYAGICNDYAKYPWDDDRGAWVNITDMILSFRQIMQLTIPKIMHRLGYFDSHRTTLLPRISNGKHLSTFIDEPELSHILTEVERSLLPRYPDVAVHYRCGDNIFFKNMGLLPFHAVLRYIPLNVSNILIVTENNTGHLFCSRILSALAVDIRMKFPSSQVVVRKGGNPFEVYGILMNSKTIICSPSTFCVYGSLSNTIGTVYLPTRKFYNTRINFENVHTMWNGRGIHNWYDADTNSSVLTVRRAVKILRNESYIQSQLGPH